MTENTTKSIRHVGPSLISAREVFKLGVAFGEAAPEDKQFVAAEWLSRYMGELYSKASEGRANMKIDLLVGEVTSNMQLLRDIIHAIPKGHGVFKSASPDKNIVSTPALRTFFVPNEVVERKVDSKNVRFLVRDLWLSRSAVCRRDTLRVLSKNSKLVHSNELSRQLRDMMNLAAWDVADEAQGADRDVAMMEAAVLQVSAFNHHEIVDITTRHQVMNDLHLMLARCQPRTTYSSVEDYAGSDDKNVVARRMIKAPGAVVAMLRRIEYLKSRAVGVKPDNGSFYTAYRTWLPKYSSTIAASEGLGLSAEETLRHVENEIRAGGISPSMHLPEFAA